MPRSWQRVVQRFPKAVDLTRRSIGEQVCFQTFAIVRCSGCGRAGAAVGASVVHAIDGWGNWLDKCQPCGADDPKVVIVEAVSDEGDAAAPDDLAEIEWLEGLSEPGLPSPDDGEDEDKN